MWCTPLYISYTQFLSFKTLIWIVQPTTLALLPITLLFLQGKVQNPQKYKWAGEKTKQANINQKKKNLYKLYYEQMKWIIMQ
jgi:hypothetical protein